MYYGDDDEVHDPATCEGGDILVIGNGAVMIGLSERTTPQGAEILAQQLLRAERRRRHARDRRRAAQDHARSCTSTRR